MNEAKQQWRASNVKQNSELQKQMKSIVPVFGIDLLIDGEVHHYAAIVAFRHQEWRDAALASLNSPTRSAAVEELVDAAEKMAINHKQVGLMGIYANAELTRLRNAINNYKRLEG